jgi:hypothetical protein
MRRREPPRKRNATAQAVKGSLGGFCVYQNGPGPVRVPRSVVSELPAGRGMGLTDQPRFLHSDMGRPRIRRERSSVVPRRDAVGCCLVGRDDAMRAKGLRCQHYAQKRTPGLAFSTSVFCNRHFSFDCANRWPRLGRCTLINRLLPYGVRPSAIDPPLRYQIVISVTACPKDRRISCHPWQWRPPCRSNKGRQS